MKKLSIFLLGALGMLAATSCEEKIDPATPQTNPQEPILEAGDITSATQGPLASAATLNLQDYAAEGSVIPIMKVEEAKDLPAGASVYYNLQLCAAEDFTGKVVTLDGTAEADGVSTVSAEDWNKAHIALFGKSPKVKTVYYRVPVYVQLDGSNYRYESTDYYAAAGSLSETCMDMGFTISDAYYFMSNATSWSLGDFTAMEPFKFAHSEADVYDDPVFTFNFEVTQDVLDANGGGCYWKLCSQEGMTAGDWSVGIYGTEVDGDDNLVGLLTDNNPQAGKLTEAGKYKLTINMESMEYEFTLLLQPEFLYTPGGANGWSQAESAFMQLCADKGFYCGLFPVDASGFKITEEPNWDYKPGNWGAESGDPALTGNFVSGDDGQNINVPAAGLYWMKANFDPQSYQLSTYELTEVTTVGMIGSFAASSWGSDVLMTSADGGKTWTADVTFAAGDEFKFRFNGDWAYNYGGKLESLVFDASNISVAEAGDYTVTLQLQPGLPKATMVAK